LAGCHDQLQEANLRTKIKSIISESKASLADDDEEEASCTLRCFFAIGALGDFKMFELL